MADIDISAGELDALARKLDGMQSMFTERERAAFVGLYALAAQAMAQKSGEGAGPTRGLRVEPDTAAAVARAELAKSAPERVLPSLGDGLRGVFVSGRPGVVGGGSPVADDVHVDVGVACVGGGWTKNLDVADLGGAVTNPAESVDHVADVLGAQLKEVGRFGEMPG